MLLIITSTGHWLFSFINIDDHEGPWTPRSGGFGEFGANFLVAAHISRVNCDEMAGDRLRQLAKEIFNVKFKF